MFGNVKKHACHLLTILREILKQIPVLLNQLVNPMLLSVTR